MSSLIKISILPLTAVFCLLAIWLFIKPIYDDAKKINNVNKPKIESLVQRENEMQQRTEKLFTAINEDNQLNSVLGAFPDDESSNELLSQFEFITNQESMTLTSVNLEPTNATSNQESEIIAQGGKTYSKVSGNMEVRGSYSQLKQLINDLYKLNRIVNINEIEIANATSEEGGTTGKFTVAFTAYWQPPITPEDVRTGLESMENVSGANNNIIPGLPTNNLP